MLLSKISPSTPPTHPAKALKDKKDNYLTPPFA
jgi:hypothetical protein